VSASPSRRSTPSKATRASKPRVVAKQPVAVAVDAIDSARLIELRSEPRSFAFIANELGLGDARAAFDAFLSALGTKSASEQKTLRTEESSRLDDLEKRTRRRSEPAQLERKLKAIAVLRQRLMAAPA